MGAIVAGLYERIPVPLLIVFLEYHFPVVLLLLFEDIDVVPRPEVFPNPSFVVE